jgi:predicted dehydrogenase
MSRTIRYGMIGCGMMGQEHLRNIALIDDAYVGAIFEPDAGMREAAARLAPKARFVDTMSELLDAQDIDALVITSPNHMHLRQLEQIAAGQPRPVLVEKPLFTCADDLDRVHALGLAAPVWVAMEYRYMPPVAALVASAQEVTGGIKMLTIREHRFPFLPKVGDWNRFNAQTGGTLVEKCCHFFDLMRHVLRSDPVRIMASGGQDVNHLDERYDGQVPDIWDNAYVIVDFANGARAMLELCMFAEGARYQEEISAVGPKGKIECLVPGPGRFWPADLGAPPVPQLIESPRHPKRPRSVDIPVDPTLLAAGDHNGSTYYQHVRFADVVRGTGPVEVSLEDGAWAVMMGLAAQHSASTGRAMTISASGFAPV